LYFIADWTDWWNLYRIDLTSHNWQVEVIFPINSECCSPQWQTGNSSYAFSNDGKLIFGINQNCSWKLLLLDLNNWTPINLERVLDAFQATNNMGSDGNSKDHSDKLPESEQQDTHIFIPSNIREIIEDLPAADASATILQQGLGSLEYVNCQQNQAIYLSATPTNTALISKIDLGLKNAAVEVFYRPASHLTIPDKLIARPEHFRFPSKNNNHAYGIFYPPTNPEYEAPENTLPPLLVNNWTFSGPCWMLCRWLMSIRSRRFTLARTRQLSR